jgi:hypothetical protein
VESNPDTSVDAMHVPHGVQLFDSDGSAGRALAGFVGEGLAHGDQIVLVTRLDHWNRAAVDLAPDFPLSDAVSSGQLTVLDSRRTLGAILDGDTPSPARFEQTITPLISQSAKRGGRVRAYGDMVDLLAEDRRFEAAAQLEELWNDLRRRVAFALLCGYSSSHFCDPTCVLALQRIRCLHSHETCAPDDFMANELLTANATV